MAREEKHDTNESRIASLRLQNREYKEMYRKWRIEHKNDYGFYFLDNSDELTYRDGEGFITETPKAAERAAISGIHTLVANFLIIYTLLNLGIWAASQSIPMIFEKASVFYDNFGYFTGNELTAFIVSFSVNIIKRILPLFYLLSRIRMPAKVFFPTKIYNRPLFNVAVPMAMLTFGVCTMLAGIFNTGLAFIGIDPSMRIWIPESRFYLAMSVILSVVIIPVLSEIVHRGILMQILKQFGDGYALVATSFIAAMVTCNYRTAMFTFLYSMLIGYFVLRSGSIITAFIMRIVISGSSYFLTYLKCSNLPDGVYIDISMMIIFIYIIVGTVLVTIFAIKHSNKINLPLYGTYLTEGERFMCLITNPSVIIWFALVFSYTVVGADIV